jgi:hypothetical protein
MIKFFRNIRQNLLMANLPTGQAGKTGRYLKYAVGEIVLVMIGILLALQVSNWNTENNNKAKEKSILADIHQEFLENKKQLDTVIFYNKRSFTNLKKLVSLFPIDIAKENLDSLGVYMYYTMFTYTFNPSQGSINSIMSTSSFNIIQNKELRKILISWNDLITDLQEDEIIAQNTVLNLIDPYFSKNLNFDFNLKDKRINLKVLETPEFEYLMKLRLSNFGDIFKEENELGKVILNIDRILELTKTEIN